MTKKLILVAIAVLGFVCSEVSEAKVCRTGDPSCDPTAGNYADSGTCDSSYKRCANPQAGAPYCISGDTALYKDENCCSFLVEQKGYQECDAAEHEVGYGGSCLGGSDNIKYWEFCGCAYGFAEVENGTVDYNIKDESGVEIPYETRCTFIGGTGKCRFAMCNEDRRWQYENGGEQCVYRLETRCGGFGCMQLYDCDNDKEYYRNDSIELTSGFNNFIANDDRDVASNERNEDGTIQTRYNLTNKIVCGYDQSDAEGRWEDQFNQNGLGCNNVVNYCYKWTGCNTARGWFGTSQDMGILYSSGEAYEKWRALVEINATYSAGDYKKRKVLRHHPIYDNFFAAYNPTYGIYDSLGTSLNGVNRSACAPGSALCDIVNKNKGCTYIKTNCHTGTPNHDCYKKIACSEENRFYSSFINAAPHFLDGSSNNLYETSINGATLDNGVPYKNAYYDGLPSRSVYPACVYDKSECNDDTGCFRKGRGIENDGTEGRGGCIADFVDIREQETLENDWYEWFEYWNPICNDGTRCYKASACDAGLGAYSSEPNTSFFLVVDSLATGLTCYRGAQCHDPAGAYSASPNTSFFVVIKSLASGSTAYRAESYHEKAGSYTSTPNTSFFNVIKSLGSGSTSYRGESVRLKAGVYSSTPNTSYFVVIKSLASGSTAYRAQSFHEKVGSYTSEPNTSYFITIKSLASGSTAYRGQEAHLKAGSYSSTPNTSFFKIQSSLASGSTAYRANMFREEAGSYTSEPNTSFFFTIKSLASGSTAYRGQEAHKEAGAYSSTPNTSFFKIQSSLASGSTAYRAYMFRAEAGSYTSTPNTSYFLVIKSLASGSTSYRGQEANLLAGAMTSAPNTSFFNMSSSLASGSKSYRGDSANVPGGAYTSEPNTSFFFTIKSQASGSTAYRGQEAHIKVGAYTSTPNTSFFIVIKSLASGSTAYRGQESHLRVGSYTSTPNTSFFIVIQSLASGSTAYRGQSFNEKAGAYTSRPNTVFFVTLESLASGSTCYRGQECAETSNMGANTSYFVFVDSKASGSVCYRSSACRADVGSYTSSPNTSFFAVSSMTNAKLDSTCYRSNGCNIPAGAYSSSPNTSFFKVISSTSTGSTSYRGEESHIVAGAYTSAPNSSFFFVIQSEASGSTSYRGQESHLKAGAYTSTPNTSFFIVIKSQASGSTSYRGEQSHIVAGAYTSAPNSSFFKVISSKASGSTSYRGEQAGVGAYTSEPNTSFFFTIKSIASGSTAYRGQEGHIKAGAYTSTPNTSFFIVIKSLASGSTAYRGEMYHEKAGAYTSTPNTSFFFVIKSLASGSTSYRGQESHIAVGAYTSAPNTLFFKVISSKASGSTSYRGEKGHPQTYTSSPNTSFFIVIHSDASGSRVYRGEQAHLRAGAYSASPNTSFFNVIKSLSSGSTSYRADRIANAKIGAYSSTPSETYFKVQSSSASGSKSYRAVACADTSIPEVNKNSSYFVYTYSHGSGSTCYRSSACRADVGSYTSSPNTSFFNILSSTNVKQDSTCYRGNGCNFPAGGYTTSPNTSFFITIQSKASGLTVYRGEKHHAIAGAYASEPNKAFFITIQSAASGSKAYRAERANIKGGAYSSAPNTAFFNVKESKASGSTAYRGVSVCENRPGSCIAHSSKPNTSFFLYDTSSASSIIAYRASAAHIRAGAYSSKPNTVFFHTIWSQASHSTSYRADYCAGTANATPNTSYFVTVNSKASGLICYRSSGCRTNAGAYDLSHKPDEVFFSVGTVTNAAQDSTCYRATSCNDATSSQPNTAFFKSTSKKASGSTCWRSTDCATGAYSSRPNTVYFKTNYSKTNGIPSYCYRGIGCNDSVLSSAKDEKFFKYASSSASGTTCYRSTACADGATTGTIDENYFVKSESETKGSPTTCRRGDSCAIARGAYSVYPNTSYFIVSSKTSPKPTTCYRVECRVGSSANNVPCYFNKSSSQGSGLTCWAPTPGNGACRGTPPTQYFYTSTGRFNDAGPCTYATSPKCNQAENFYFTTSSSSTNITNKTGTCSDITAYYINGCNRGYNWWASYSNSGTYDAFFNRKGVTASGANCSHALPTCYKYTSARCSMTDTTHFKIETLLSPSGYSGTSDTNKSLIAAKYISGCNTSGGWWGSYANSATMDRYFYKSTVNAPWNMDAYTYNCGKLPSSQYCYKYTSAKCSKDNESVFTYTTTSVPATYAGGTSTNTYAIPAYYPSGCAAGYCASAVDSVYFKYPSPNTTSGCNHSQTCYSTACRFTGAKCSDMNVAYENRWLTYDKSTACGTDCWRCDGAFTSHYVDSSTVDYCAYDSMSGLDKKCGCPFSTAYKETSCASGYSYSKPSETYFRVSNPGPCAGSQCYQATSCNTALYYTINESSKNTVINNLGSGKAFTGSSTTYASSSPLVCANCNTGYTNDAKNPINTTYFYVDRQTVRVNESDSYTKKENGYNIISCTKPTGCKLSTCDTKYFKDPKTTTQGGMACPIECVGDDCCHYETCDTRYYEQPYWTSCNGKSCPKETVNCKYPYSTCDPEYFDLTTKKAPECNGIKTCYTGVPDRANNCRLTDSEISWTTNADLFYWGGTGDEATCGDVTRMRPYDCNKDNLSYNISYEDDALSSSNISSGLDGISNLKKDKPAYYKDVYYFEKVNAKSEIDSSCDERICVIKCSCQSGWNDTVGTRTAQKEFITLTSKINRRLSCTKAVGCDDYGYSYTSCPDGYNCGTAQKPYGTLVCYAQQTAKTCSDYGYVDSCPSGQTGTAHSVKLGSTTSTCYSDCKENAKYYTLTLQGNGCSGSTKCDLGPCKDSTCSKKGTGTDVSVKSGESVTITSTDSSKTSGFVLISMVDGHTDVYSNRTSFSFTMPAHAVKVVTTPKTTCNCDSGSGGSGEEFHIQFYTQGTSFMVACGDGTPSNYSGASSASATLKLSCTSPCGATIWSSHTYTFNCNTGNTKTTLESKVLSCSSINGQSNKDYCTKFDADISNVKIKCSNGTEHSVSNGSTFSCKSGRTEKVSLTVK
ncbi:MAG: hypothetical protein J6J35_07580 [Alphaproteobacteria bacterium]|nr:hypothetical protein [Alphaproteobacteria bacterium]